MVLDDTGNDEEYPPSAQAGLAAVDAALDRIPTATPTQHATSGPLDERTG
ncbi:hypothetical protein [Streptomyces sp. NPDC059786]